VGKFALLEVKIDTGRTHQIRVHLSSLGHPVAGDTLYGAPGALHGHNASLAPLSRNFLHSANIEFAHPRTNEALAFASEIPQELKQFLARLEPERRS
jgi:23S rRNA pseudouridine1911/1915/1917 synthase